MGLADNVLAIEPIVARVAVYPPSSVLVGKEWQGSAVDIYQLLSDESGRFLAYPEDKSVLAYQMKNFPKRFVNVEMRLCVIGAEKVYFGLSKKNSIETLGRMRVANPRLKN